LGVRPFRRRFRFSIFIWKRENQNSSLL
jgi:hypothetical protein